MKHKHTWFFPYDTKIINYVIFSVDFPALSSNVREWIKSIVELFSNVLICFIFECYCFKCWKVDKAIYEKFEVILSIFPILWWKILQSRDAVSDFFLNLSNSWWFCLTTPFLWLSFLTHVPSQFFKKYVILLTNVNRVFFFWDFIYS